MECVIQVLAGPASVGKTDQLLERYRNALLRAAQEVRPGSTLWLSPTNRSCQEIRRRLLDSTLPVVFNPNVFTFDEFARRIVETGPQRVIEAPRAVLRTLLRGIVHRLTDAGQLQYFAGIAPTAGFLDTVVGLIAELKMGDIWPEDFRRICNDAGATPRDRELALLYEQYQAALIARNLYDQDGLFWSAREALKHGHSGGFGQFDLVVVDGFTDFAHAQFDILFQLAKSASETCVSLLLETPVRRPDLFAKTQAVLARLQSRATVHVDHCKPVAATGAEGRPKALDLLGHNLFGNPREVEVATESAGVEILAVAGHLAEMQELAARVKSLLLDGVKPDQIVVGLRNIGDYASLIDETFTAAGIPIACEAGQPLSRFPVIKALVSVLQLEVDDWPFDQLCAVLHSNYFHPAWDEFAQGGAAFAATRALRSEKLDGQRMVILEVLQREATRAADDASHAASGSARQQRRETAARAYALLDRLSRAVEPLRQPHDWETWGSVLCDLAQELGLLNGLAPQGVDESAPADWQAWQAFQSLLAVLSAIERLPPANGAPTIKRPLAEYLFELTDLLHEEAVYNSPPEAGRVRVLDAAQVRHLDVPHLFLAGLTETSFPRHRGDDCLYSSSERQRLLERGLSLGQRSDRNQEEMLMFYGVVTRARQRLVLSYPAVGGEGQPLSPSPYLTILRSLFDPKTLACPVLEQLSPIPPPERVLTWSDARVRGMHDALDRRPGLLRALCERPDQFPAVANLLAAVELTNLRFHTPGFTNFEGRLESDWSARLLAERFPRDYEFSATQLESYAACPFRFFMEQVLNLAPPESPELETDFLQRGVLVHDVLAELHRQLIAAKPPHAGQDLAQRFMAILESELEREPGRSEVRAALQKVERRLLAEWAEAYGRQWDDYCQAWSDDFDAPPAPHALELAFGSPLSKSDKPAEPAPPCLTLGPHTNEVRIRGRIDRIDLGRNNGQPCFAVIDYKTGREKQSSQKAVAAGLTLQLPLYMLAVERLQLAGPGARPGQMGYWFLKAQGFVPGLKTDARRRSNAGQLAMSAIEPLDAAVWSAVLQTLEEVVPRLASGIRRGEFPVYNADQDCTQYCPFDTVCRVGQIRALPPELGKTLNPDGDADDAHA